VHGAIRDEWASLGWELGLLGFPTSNETPTGVGGGRFNDFQQGVVYWSPATGAHEAHGAIGALYSSLGGPGSSLGYPISDEFPFFSVRISVFEHGYIEWSAQDGAHVH
jgi:uncharacterized protein with LGFP repeats